MYESWFGLNHRPFRMAPHPDRYFSAEDIDTALKLIIGCVESGAGPALVVGPTGTGKTTLALQVKKYFEALMPVALVSGTTCLTRRTLLQNVLAAVGLPYQEMDDGNLRISLTEYFQSRGNAGSLLIVDEAGLLESEILDEVRGFSSLTSDAGWSVHVVLLGTMRLEEHLAMPSMESLNQRIATRCYLGPWTREEIETFIESQLESAGTAARAVFDQSAIDKIREITGSVPRLVNQLCDHSLACGAKSKVTEISGAVVEAAWADLQKLPAPSAPVTTDPQQASDIVEFGSLDELDNGISSGSPTNEHEQDDFFMMGSLQEESPESNDPPLMSGADRFPVLDKSPSEDPFDDSSTENSEPTVVAENQAAAWLNADHRQVDGDPTNDLVLHGEPKIADHTGAAVANIEEVVNQMHDEAREFTDPTASCSETDSNPFLEQFEDEEVVIGRPVGLQTDCLVADQVNTPEGRLLSEELQMQEMRGILPADLMADEPPQDATNGVMLSAAEDESSAINDANATDESAEVEVAAASTKSEEALAEAPSLMEDDGSPEQDPPGEEASVREETLPADHWESPEAVESPREEPVTGEPIIRAAIAGDSTFDEADLDQVATDEAATDQAATDEAVTDHVASDFDVIRVDSDEMTGDGTSWDAVSTDESDLLSEDASDASGPDDSFHVERMTGESYGESDSLAEDAQEPIICGSPSSPISEDHEPFEPETNTPLTERETEGDWQPTLTATRRQFGESSSSLSGRKVSPLKRSDGRSRRRFSRLFSKLRKKN